MNHRTASIINRSDQGHDAAAIARAECVTVGRVYAVLRKHRPYRSRKARRHTSTLPQQMRALREIGTAPRRIAELLDVAPAYVYRVLNTGEE